MVFNLYLLINTLPEDTRYPYIGIADESPCHIHINEYHINLIAENDSYYDPKDYFLTSRCIDLDLNLINEKVHEFIRQDDYELVTWFGEHRSMAIAYYYWPDGKYLVRNIFETRNDEPSRKMLDSLYPMMEKIFRQAHFFLP